MQLIREEREFLHRREIDVSCARGIKIDDEREMGGGGRRGPLVRVRERLFIFRPISNYRRYERPRIAAASTERRIYRGVKGEKERVEGERKNPCVIGIHLWGSHVLSQFAVFFSLSLLSPVPSFSRLSHPVAAARLLRFVARFSLPSSRFTSRGGFTWRGNMVIPPTNILRKKRASERAASRVKRQVQIVDARGGSLSSCRLIASRTRHPLVISQAEFN